LRLDARLRGRGAAEQWDAVTGRQNALAWREHAGSAAGTLVLPPFASRFIVLGGDGKSPPSDPEPDDSTSGTALVNDWSISLDNAKLDGPLRTWAEIGHAGFSGAATYSKTFRRPAGARRIWLDLGEVRYSARVRINGRDLGVRAWRPFRWDITSASKPGENSLEIEVCNTAANELSGNPDRLKEVESKGWLVNSYFRTYSPFDAEMVPSGLLGPVRVLWR